MTVLLIYWDAGLYPSDIWECIGYTEYCCGIPKFAELRRIK